MNSDIKRIVDRVKTAQGKLQSFLKSQAWVEEARKYAESQSKEVRRLLSGDLNKVRVFIEKERKELGRFQKQIPGEVAKLRNFVQGQRRELQKLVTNVRKAAQANGKGAAKSGAPKKRRTPSRKRKTASTHSAT